jgi:hypothetical protein
MSGRAIMVLHHYNTNIILVLDNILPPCETYYEDICCTIIILTFFFVAFNLLKSSTRTGVGTHKGANGITLQKDYESFLILFHFFI